MATGDWTNIAFAAGGTTLTADIEGLASAGLTAIASGKSITYGCTSKISGSASTAARSGVPLLFKSVAALGGATIAADTFTDTNGTALADHTPDTDAVGTGWAVLSGTWTISGNKAVTATTGRAVLEAGIADGTATVTWSSVNSATSGGLCLRATDDNNWLRVYVDESANTVVLQKRVTGTVTTVNSAAVTGGITTNTNYVVAATLSGSSVIVYVDGVQYLSETVADHQAVTKHGLHQTSNATLDSYSFVSLETGATVTFDLSEPIHDTDTSPTLTADVGALNDGSHASAALAAVAGNNNSTLVGAVPVCVIVSEMWRKHTAAFYVDVYACGGVYTGYRDNLGISKVSVTVTDTAGAGTAKTLEATTISAVDAFDSTNGAYAKALVFRVGPFDPSDWDGGGTDAAQGLATVVATAYPAIGDAGDLGTSPTEYIFLDAANGYEVRHAVVDPTSGDDGAGLISSGDGGYWAGTDSVDATAEANPYATIQAAARDCQAGDGTTAAPSGGKASWSVIYLEEDDHTYGTYSVGTAIDTTDGPLIITRKPGTVKANVKLVASGDTNGLKTNVVTLDDLTVRLGAAGTIETAASPSTSSTVWTAADSYMIWRDVDWVGEGRTANMSATPLVGFDNTWWYGGTRTALKVLTGGGRIARDITYSSLSTDSHGLASTTNGKAIVNNVYDDIDPDGTGTHVDIIQIPGTSDYTATNIAYSQCVMRNLNHVQSPIFGNAGSYTITVNRFAMTFLVSEDDGQTELAQLDDIGMTNWFVYHNTLFDQLLYTEDGDRFAQTNCWFVRNYCSISINNTPATTTAGYITNHNRNASGFADGYDWTTGGVSTDDFADVDTTYLPLSSGEAVDRWALADTLSPYSANGTEITSSNAGFLGALAEASGGGPIELISSQPLRGRARMRGRGRSAGGRS